MNTTKTNNRSAQNCADKHTAAPYAVLSEENTVLTFYYDDLKETRNGYNVGPFNKYDEPWGGVFQKNKSRLF